MMPEAIKAGATCIDCHKGIAHHLPIEPAESDESEKK
jgi:nitrate/TMAO reductase-like tetraheme cytochrome c subunit